MVEYETMQKRLVKGGVSGGGFLGVRVELLKDGLNGVFDKTNEGICG